MFEQILENYRKATESTLEIQQTMLRSLTTPWPQMPGFTNPAAEWVDQAQSAQRKWSETISDMLNKHRESLDVQYRAGIKTIESAFRAGEAKDPAQFRRLTEELWKQCFECLKTVSEAQMKDVQAAMQKWMEVASQNAPGSRSEAFQRVTGHDPAGAARAVREVQGGTGAGAPQGRGRQRWRATRR